MKPSGIEKTENPDSKIQQNPEQTVPESTQKKVDDIMDEGEVQEQEGSKKTEQKSEDKEQSTEQKIDEIMEEGEADSKETNAENKDNAQEQKDVNEPKKGGRYSDVKKNTDGEKQEVHHMPADSASNLERNDGPAIAMDKEDHRQTASCGNSKEAREYRAKQKELIDQGKFKEALQMDIDDIHEKFGDKYDDAIKEMMDYVDELEQEGKIDG